MQIKRQSMLQRLFHSTSLLFSHTKIGVKYSRNPETYRNWGDALNRYLLPRISGKQIVHYSEYLNLGLFPTISAIGSVLDNNQVKNLHVWGSGLKSADSEIPRRPAKVLAVRGKLTRKRLTDMGVKCPDVFGDPALLMPRFYNPKNVPVRYSIGVIPHYIDKKSEVLRELDPDEIKIIDVENDIEIFIDDILSCERIVSSSLHGIIAADAYGIPRAWMKLSDRIKGEGFKFNDYFSTTDVQNVKQLLLQGPLQKHELHPYLVQPQRLPDLDRLLSTFPSPTI